LSHWKPIRFQAVRVALSAAILPDFLYRAVDKAYTISGIKALALKVKKRW
jgi:hypothetical protein